MSLINKMFNMIGIEFGGEEEEFDEEFLDDAKKAEPAKPFVPALDDDYAEFGGKKNKVVKIHTTAQLKLVVIQPESFEEAKDIAIHLKSKKPVVMNLEMVDRDVQRRIVDFLSGAVYALDGNIQKVSNGIFLIAPYNVGIMGDFKDELRNKGIFPQN